MKLFYPVKNPINQSNLFGANPAEYAPQKGHPGIDFEASLDTPIYAPVAGNAFYTIDQDKGDGIWIRVTDEEGNHFNVILWHLPPASDPIYHALIPISDTDPVTPVTAGQDLGWSGNSGYPLESTGPHLHLGVMPCDANWAALEPNNGYEGCVDPTPYFNGLYASDINATPTTAAAGVAVETATQTVQTAAGSPLGPATKSQFLQKVAQILNALKSFFK